jgi:hypothetical protein
MRHVLWGVCGAFVLLYIFLTAVGAFEPGEVLELTILAVALAVVFLVHEWRGQFRVERFRH